MSSMHETLLFHDAPRQRLDFLAEQAATDVARRYGWKRTMGDLPGSIGLRVPWSAWSWGERVSLVAEERSIRILSRCVLPVQVFAGAKNLENLERVRESLKRAIAEQPGEAGT